eukprot:gene2597-2408_t
MSRSVREGLRRAGRARARGGGMDEDSESSRLASTSGAADEFEDGVGTADEGYKG